MNECIAPQNSCTLTNEPHGTMVPLRPPGPKPTAPLTQAHTTSMIHLPRTSPDRNQLSVSTTAADRSDPFASSGVSRWSRAAPASSPFATVRSSPDRWSDPVVSDLCGVGARGRKDGVDVRRSGGAGDAEREDGPRKFSVLARGRGGFSGSGGGGSGPLASDGADAACVGESKLTALCIFAARANMPLMRAFALVPGALAGGDVGAWPGCGVPAEGKGEGTAGPGDAGACCPARRFSETTVSSMFVGMRTFFSTDSLACRYRASASNLCVCGNQYVCSAQVSGWACAPLFRLQGGQLDLPVFFGQTVVDGRENL